MTESASPTDVTVPPKTGESGQSQLVLALLSIVATIGLYWDICTWLVKNWYSNQDYSHGFFIPLASGYLIWTAYKSSGSSIGSSPRSRDWVVALGLITTGVLLRVFGIYARVLTLEGLSLLPHLLGVLVLVFGVSAARWALPGICYLAFMLPLPGAIAGSLSGLLQSVATQVSTFVIQILGVPAVATGNIITLSSGEVGVAEACSGIRMLYSFFALTVGACMLIDRTWIEKLLIGLSAIPIAVAANCIRITATALAFEYMDPEFAKKEFHDMAGWFMMPIGFLLLFVVLQLLERLILVERDGIPNGSLSGSRT